MAERSGYSGVQKALHWAVALLVLGMVPVGIVISDFDNKPAVEAVLGAGGFDWIYDQHKIFGMVLLLLMALRLLVRALRGAPAHVPPLPRAEALAAAAVHWALYALLILVPVLGWIGISAYPALPNVWGLGMLPGIVGPDRELAEAVLRLHGPLGILIGVLAVVHVAAAIRHAMRGDGVMRRMTVD